MDIKPSEMHLKYWFAASENGYVVGVGDVELTKIINQRDARLIAAAPDLLAALESAFRWAAPMRDAPRDIRPDWFNQARAAITKAIGEFTHDHTDT